MFVLPRIPPAYESFTDAMAQELIRRYNISTTDKIVGYYTKGFELVRKNEKYLCDLRDPTVCLSEYRHALRALVVYAAINFELASKDSIMLCTHATGDHVEKKIRRTKDVGKHLQSAKNIMARIRNIDNEFVSQLERLR